MSVLWGNLAGVITVVLMVVFIGIWIWAWQRRHKKVFDEMARLPMEDDGSPDSGPEGRRRASEGDQK